MINNLFLSNNCNGYLGLVNTDEHGDEHIVFHVVTHVIINSITDVRGSTFPGSDIIKEGGDRSHVQGGWNTFPSHVTHDKIEAVSFHEITVHISADSLGLFQTGIQGEMEFRDSGD